MPRRGRFAQPHQPLCFSISFPSVWIPRAGWEKRNQLGISLTFDFSFEQTAQFLIILSKKKKNKFHKVNMLSSLDKEKVKLTQDSQR